MVSLILMDVQTALVLATDRDRDGVPDHLDNCPLSPETYNKFQDEDGCPDNVADSAFADTDNDGIEDKIDFCPTDPEIFNGYRDTDGCPDVAVDITIIDTDGDGIADKSDNCPKQPETFNRFADYDGCPDSIPAFSSLNDSDSDGIVDAI